MTDEIVPAVTETASVQADAQAIVESPQTISDVIAEIADPAPAPAEPSDEALVLEKRNKTKERIEDLVAEKNAAKEYAEYWRLKALELIKPAPAAQVVEQAKVPADAPTLEQFGFDQAKWSRAVGEWNKAQVRVQVEQALEAQRTSDSQQSVVAAFAAKVEQFKETHPDWDTVMANPRLPQLAQVASAMIVASDHSAELTYALGKNPDLTTKISRMNSSNQALAIGRLEAEIRAPKSEPVTPKPAPVKAEPAKAKEITKAPPPLDVIPSGGNPEPNPDNMSVSEFMKWRLESTRQRKRLSFNR